MHLNKKTILYIGGELPDKSAAAHRIFSNGKALNNYGYNVVFLSDDKGMSYNENPIKKDIQGFSVWYTGYPKENKQWIDRLVSTKIIQNIIEKYSDISTVIYYGPSAIPLLKLKRYCFKKNISLIADCTEWHTLSHLSGVKKMVKFFDINLTLRYAQKKIDGLIVISSFWEQYYKEKKILKLIPLIDKSDSKWEIKVEKEHSERQKIFVYAGNMGTDKDRLNNIIDALYLLKSHIFTLNIIGITKREYIQKFPYQIAILDDLGSKIVFHGYLPHRETIDCIKKADFSFLIRESNRKNNAGFPTKFGESITCGTPVIASDFSDVKEILDKYSLGIMIDDLNDIKKGIYEALIMDKNEVNQLTSNCLNCPVFSCELYTSIIGEFISNIEMEKNKNM